MPGMDGTGPDGTFVSCVPQYGRRFFGRGFGRGRGIDLGLRYTRPVTLTKEAQKKILEAELKEIEAEKQEIEARLKELK